MSGAQDKWSRWLLETRFGGDAAATDRAMEELRGVRDRVLEGARIERGETVLDVGCGDGLIGFGALDRVGVDGRVVFSDVSQPLLDHVRALAEEMGVCQRCDFVLAAAEDLSPIGDASVDVVTTRSVLIYVRDKEAAFREFHRVLRSEGRVSLFEPINRFNETYEPQRTWWDVADATARELGSRLRNFFRSLQPLDGDPMMNFDETGLLRACESAGFRRAHLAFHVFVAPSPPARWEAYANAPGNPTVPSLAGAMEQVFTPEERAHFEAQVRPLVEAGGFTRRSAVAYLRATKDG